MKLNLKTLTLTGFRSVWGPEQIDLPDHGLVLIRGKNGAGKSTIFAGIAHALGYAPYPASKLQNWNDGAPDMEVSLQMQGDAYVGVWRGKKPYGFIGRTSQDTGVGFTTAKVVDEKLQAVIGLTPEMLEALTYRQQRRPGLFINKTDAEKKEFLCALLKLDQFESAVEIAQAKIKELTPIQLHTKTRHEELIKELADAQDGLVEPQYESTGDIDVRMQNIEMQIKDRKVLYTQAAEQLQLQRSTTETDPEVVKFEQAILEIDSRRDAINAEWSRTREETIAQISADRREIYTKLNALTQLEAGECPTCHRPFDQKPDPQEKAIVETLARSKQEQYIQASVVRIPPRLKKLMEFRIETEGKLKEAKLKALAVNSGHINAQHALVMRLTSEIEALTKALWNHKEWKQRVESDNAFMKQRHEDALQRTETLAGAMTKYGALAEQHTLALNAEQDFVRMIGREGFLGSIFDEILAEISHETNRLLAQIPNVSHVTIHFSSDTTTQKNKPKKEIVPIISINGHRAPFQSGCSGGMQSSIEFVVDLAVSEVISRRTGASPQWLLLDECFEGMDPDAKVACMEILQVYAQDKLVLVIDHESTFKEMFTMFIDVTQENNRTVIQSAT